ncbi:NACHT domain-containing protein [Virgibacillus kekensis]|uniref:NACHT domain-containing protein n=1 Tax=Virgibacillus kekensis TaxID=202261 RepID=A0ABV9DGN0_9BACI
MDFSYRLSIPKIKCGESISSGFLVRKNIVITALHSINPYLANEEAEVKVIFINEKGQERKVIAEPLLPEDGKWKDYQIIALKLEEEISDINILECMDYKFNYTTDCYTYGYPAVRELNGTLIDLEIIGELKKTVGSSYDKNLDVKVKSDSIKDYSGCSGGPLLFNNRVIGVMLNQSSESGEASRLSAVSLYLYNEYFKWLDLPLIGKDYDLDYEGYLKSKKKYLQKQLDNPLSRGIKKIDVNPLGFAIKIKRKEKPNDLYDFSWLLETDDSTLILSKPGGGKTYLLRMLMLEILENPIFSRDKIPVLLRAKDWHRDYKSIVDGIKSELIYDLPKLTDEKIVEALKEGKFILLIDGFDEIRSNKDLFIKEIERLELFENLKVIMTCRQQNYHSEFHNLLNEYILQPLTDEQIREYVATAYEEDISYPFVHSLKKSLKDLIESPLFLYMTVEIMKSTTKREIPKNKSELYDIFIEYMMQHRLNKVEEMRYELELKLEILSDYAYSNFSDPENNNKFSEVASKYIDRLSVTSLKRELLQTGVVIEERNRLEFSHPSLEEYFTALRISKMDEQDIITYIFENHADEIYTEVFKFISGLLRNAKQQNILLDRLEKINIYLYRQCLESRFNFTNKIEKGWSRQYLIDYLKQIRKSYLVIINSYFKEIKSEFYPWCKNRKSIILDENIIIEGGLDVNSSSLMVEVNFGEKQEYVKVIENSSAPVMTTMGKDGKEILIPIKTLNAGNHWYFDLKSTHLGLDSAREVAMYIIKDQLKKLVEKQMLFEYEPPESIVPCIEYVLSRLPREYFYVEQNGQRKTVSLYEHPADTIIKVLGFGDNIFKYIQSRRTYGDLNQDYVAFIIYKFFDFARKGVEFKDYLLPKEDLKPDLNGRNSYWIWEVWSDERVEERLSVFFDFYQKSYRKLVENCFPLLSGYMPLYSMGPVRYQIGLERDEKGDGGISYRWVPVKSMEDAWPNVESRKEESFVEIYERKNTELNRALLNLSRRPLGGYTQSSAVLTTYINDDREVRNKVYKRILDDLKFVLGKIK